MNVNFGLFPPLSPPVPERIKGDRSSKTLARKHALATRALADLERWLAGGVSIAAE
jgi:methylenetetrahydrofolate--tRNA-(uracil-5-)-methyltransferase